MYIQYQSSSNLVVLLLRTLSEPKVLVMDILSSSEAFHLSKNLGKGKDVGEDGEESTAAVILVGDVEGAFAFGAGAGAGA